LAPRIDQPLNLLASFAEDMRARGLTPSYLTRSVEIAVATEEVAEALGIAIGTRLGMIDRLLLANGGVIGLSLSWLSPTTVSVSNLPTLAELDTGSLYRWIEKRTGHRISGGSEFIEAVNADDQIAASLNVAARAAVLLARRISRTADGQSIEYAMLYYRPDLYRFHIELTRP